MKYKKKNIDPKVKQRSGQTGVEANKSKRTKRFEIRFTPEEWTALQERAIEACSSSTAHFARAVLLPVNHAKDLETKTEHKLRIQLLASLGKIGSNINQIARSLNRFKVWNDTTEDVFKELTKTQEAVTTIAELFRGKK